MNDNLIWHIASYPRSGNHLVRSIVEAYSHRPTEGCLGAGRDRAIYSRRPNSRQIIKVFNDEPIGYKAHFLFEIHERERIMPDREFGMILITRDPVSAIVSQSVRILKNRRKHPLVTERSVRVTVQKQVESYLSLVFRFTSFPKERRLHIRFEDLLAPDLSEQTTKVLLEKIGAELEGPPLESVIALAKASQNSLHNNRTHLENRIREAVQERISYEEIHDYLGLNGGVQSKT